jgi:hypothetical protein
MKKLFILFIALALLAGVSCEAFADANTVAYTGGSGIGTTQAVTLINSSTSGYDVTYISPTSYIVPANCEIIGYEANAIGSASLEGLFSIRDAISTTESTDSYIINESEVTATVPVSQLFPRGLRVTRGVAVHQGPLTSVTIYYVQVRP